MLALAGNPEVKSEPVELKTDSGTLVVLSPSVKIALLLWILPCCLR
jgi:hypothetical protein